MSAMLHDEACGRGCSHPTCDNRSWECRFVASHAMKPGEHVCPVCQNKIAMAERLTLNPEIEKALLDNRDDEASRMFHAAARLMRLSAAEYLMRGFGESDLNPPELRRLLKLGGWREISFDAYVPGWRALWHNGTNVCEGPITDEEVLAVFGPRRRP